MRKFIKTMGIIAMLLLFSVAVVSAKAGYTAMQSETWADGTDYGILLQQTAEGGEMKVKLDVYKDGKRDLYPLVCPKPDENTDIKQIAGYTDYVVKAKNTGSSSARIRFYVAVPKALDNGALHMDTGSDFTETKLTETTMIKGMEYNVYALTYNGELEKDETSPAAVYGFHLHKDATLRGKKIYVNDTDTGFKNDTVEVYTVVHAYRLDNGETFENIEIKVPTFYDVDGDNKVPVNNISTNN